MTNKHQKKEDFISHPALNIKTFDNSDDVTRVSGEKREPQILKKSADNLYNALTAKTLAGVYILREGRFVYINPYFANTGCYAPEELLGRESMSIVYPEDRESVKRYARDMLRNKRIAPYEFRIIGKDGKIYWIMETVTAIIYEERPAVLGNAMDITELKEARIRLDETESLKSSILASIPHSVFGLDNRRIIFVNDAVEAVFGWKPEELIGRSTRMLYRSDEEFREISKLLYPALKKSFKLSMELDFPCRHKDGHDLTCRITASRIGEKLSHKRIVATYEDITARKTAENNLINTLRQLQEAKEMLVQSEKLASIGRLSAGVAHEILNPVNIISMNLQLIIITETLSLKTKKALKNCIKEIDRVVQITKNLRQFSRVIPKCVALNHPNRVMDYALSMIKPRLKQEKVTLYRQYQNDLPVISIDASRIEQVFLNILSNAIDAMEGKKKKILRVITKLDKSENGDIIRIIISDNGIGIKPEDIYRLFDPFFTTKEQGKGIGLGLAISYGIIADHGGRILVENNDIGGASFMVDLPITYH